MSTDGIVIFEDRLILDARPPITQAERDAVEARCAGPIPDGLLALWQASFGGRIDYALSVEFGDHVHEFSFTELFYPGSDGYRDLPGWIEHEAEHAEAAADEAGDTWRGTLAFLPFGGFEYLDRLYVCVEPGPDYGAVFAYAQGLPPAWPLQLHHAALARIADDVPALFRRLDLPTDPALGSDAHGPGNELMEGIDEVRARDPARAASLEALVRAAVTDWRAALADGSIAARPRPRRLALEAASSRGDIALLAALRGAGCDLDEPFRGGGAALDHALAAGRLEAAAWLIEQGCDPRNAIANGAAQAPPDLVRTLLARGAAPTAIAAQTAARSGRMESAQLIADALARVDPSAVEKLIADLAHAAGGADASAKRIDAGTLGSSRSAEEYRHEAARLRALRNHCRSLVGSGS
ncbi:ankyrin repeat domain-containing protein [Sphingosinicella sp. BN140058]|uniref:ankyrin repeat domain-containing protein n=1 Tax=Sphingosinicella sp. BN140058 TaxID=1892855 RepID=UPI0010127102|nr:ankyrin repeat domain-containing protein [Sphingosinicella sp. BN140058]QAY75596.1 ankyrin repeat domain-containing protein [Sphingosinicella sp. BN140058]